MNQAPGYPAGAMPPRAPVVTQSAAPTPPIKPALPVPTVRTEAVGTVNEKAPVNRFVVLVHKDKVWIRGLPIGKLSAAEVRGFCAHLLHCADQVATPEDPEFADLFAALVQQEPAK